MMRWIIVTGLPATGKTTLARQLAARYALPMLAKDAFKERLLDESGPVDARRSRELSNLAFTALFTRLGELASGARDVLIDGNFRAGEHEAALRKLPTARLAQVLCRSDEAQRLARIAARASDPMWHPGHGDVRAARDASNDAFLDLPGERFIAVAEDPPQSRMALLADLDRWWHPGTVR
jgi:predicted kinase